MFTLLSEAIGLADDQTVVCRVCRRIYDRSSLPYQELCRIDLSQCSVMDSSSSVV